MKRMLVIAAFAVCMPLTPADQNIAGDWQGTLNAGSVQLRLVLHISQERNGGLKATLDSVDRGVNLIPVTSIVLRHTRLSFMVNSVNGSYEGALDMKATTIHGTWPQGQPLPLDFQRAATTIKMELRNARPFRDRCAGFRIEL